MIRIPVNEPLLGPRESEYVMECLRTGWISSAGHFIEQFEEQWSHYCKRRYGVSVSNGTTALQVAVRVLDLGAGDEVIMPSFTIISCALAVMAVGAKPVLVDSDPDTWCMDVRQVEERLTSRTRAIMPVHIYGHPVDMESLLDIAERHGLYIIEDAAEAHGAECQLDRASTAGVWRRCGSFGTVSCFSFYANKLITTGEGGMVLTDDPQLAERLRMLRNLCFLPGRRFYHEELGYNFRLTNLQAAMGLAQLERIDEIVARKRAMGKRYNELLDGIPGLQLPSEQPWARSVYWMYGVVLDEQTGLDADKFSRRLQEYEVETRPFFLGMHEQPVLRQEGLFVGEHYPVAERLARQGLYVPSGLGLTDEQLERVCTAIRKVLK